MHNAARLEQGYTLILPGCLGHGFWDDQVAHGLVQSKVPTAIEIYDWTRGPHMLAFNVLDKKRKQRAIQTTVAKIVRYQQEYPGRPVHLIGHSGGGSLAIKTLEALPPESRVTNAILLAPGVSSKYDLRLAQQHTDRGIHNFYSPYDVLISGAFVVAVGTYDGDHLRCAGLVGFDQSQSADMLTRYPNSAPLVQHAYSLDMLGDGHVGGHFGWTTPTFVGRHLAPLLAQTDPVYVPESDSELEAPGE
jgi:pimeloyl-ACP methyl ester carboxylesterase